MFRSWRRARDRQHAAPLTCSRSRPLLNAAVPQDYYSVLNFGGRFPIYGPPAGFVMRLGAVARPISS